MINARLAEGGRIHPMDFHAHWHWYRPLPGSAPIILQSLILDPETRQRRRTEETARREQARQHARARRAQTGRILSQFEQQRQVLHHCSACIEFGHDKVTCRGCKSTDRRRNACPHVAYQRRVAVDSTAHQLNIEDHRQALQSHPQQLSTIPAGLQAPLPGPSSLMGMQLINFPPNSVVQNTSDQPQPYTWSNPRPNMNSYNFY